MKFRKKPVVIEARQLGIDYDEDCAVMRWCGGTAIMEGDNGALFTVPTLEGPLTARTGDWIIRGIQGEFYPCKPDIFAATYESATSADAVDPVGGRVTG